ncbi:MAG: hydroxymethylbilane synthase [Rhodospirillaceae bacterium]|nr:hydroxymethylbilane synthase [Rhodospirillaceae bacterium]|tara:strand:- start:1419 stop:2360 length:942 start_codon:yes stop_codon:yes gene_type:complete
MSDLKKPIRIGSRGSPLALIQARYVERLLRFYHVDLTVDATEIVPIQTSGDKIQGKTLSTIGGKGLFTKELDAALLAAEIDIAVHSMKDMPTVLPSGIIIACVLPREDPRDALIARNGVCYADLPTNAVIGSASLRRCSQLLAHRPDVQVVALRGNVETRLAKLEAGLVDATLLAVAGLKRLGRVDAITEILSTDDMLPAVAQGAIAVVCRASDSETIEVLQDLNHPETLSSVTAERAFLEHLDGSCQTPIAALAKIKGAGKMVLSGLLAAPDGSRVVRGESVGEIASAVDLGRSLGAELLAEAGSDFLLPSR